MPASPVRSAAAAFTLAVAMFAAPVAFALTIGQVKSVEGEVEIIRNGTSEAAEPGASVEVRDVIVTGADGMAGITFTDNTTLGLGPDTRLNMTTYFFEQAGREDRFEARLDHGTLTATSGRIAKKRQGAMTFVTPTTVLAVRGTSFVLRVARPESGADAPAEQ